MVAQLTKTNYSPAEYLDLEDKSEIRHEFINGEIIAMAGGTTNHNEIITNLCVFLKPILRQKKGKIYTENVRVFISEYNIFTYPDVMIMAEEPIYYSKSKTTVTNPIIIIKVLSESTKDYDLGRKFGYYRSLESLQEYVLIEPEDLNIMIYRRNNQKKWSLEILNLATEVLELQSMGVEILLSNIYEGVNSIVNV
jgi:Uma2 family endonuclease